MCHRPLATRSASCENPFEIVSRARTVFLNLFKEPKAGNRFLGSLNVYKYGLWHEAREENYFLPRTVFFW
jgi:hypothetical protein